jgi:hypothetical protein
MYDEYVKQIQKAVSLRNWAFRFRFLLIGIGSLIAISAASLVGTKGLVTNAEAIGVTYLYGEPLNYRCSAFMGTVSYEFSAEGSGLWSPEQPRIPGHYRLRGKSSNNFGSSYYGPEQPFTIVPKPISLAPAESEITYGDSPTMALDTPLVAGDYLDSHYLFDFGDKTQTNWNITPKTSSVAIHNAQGEDVTSYYTLSSKTVLVGIRKRSLSIQTQGASKFYDGTPLSQSAYSIVSGNLVPGDHLAVSRQTFRTDVGSSSNDLGFSVSNEQGEDMSNHYAIQVLSSALTVTPTPLSFSGEDFTYIYDGTSHLPALTSLHFQGDSAQLAGGEIHYAFLNQSDHIRVGNYADTFAATILKGGVDITPNFSIHYAFGTTHITSRPVQISCGSVVKTYDGQLTQNLNYSITGGSLAAKDEVKISDGTAKIEAGEYANELRFDIADRQSGVSFLDCYETDLVKGQISITKRGLKVSLTPAEYVYDGLPHHNAYAITSGSLAKGNKLVEKNNPSFSDVGTFDNPDFSLGIVDADGNDVSPNYDFALLGIDKAMKITARGLKVQLNSRSKLYDGAPISSSFKEGEAAYTLIAGELAANEYIDFAYQNDPIEAGTTPISSTFIIRHQSGSAPDKTVDRDVTGNYTIELTTANFTIAKRTLILTTLDTSHTYDRDSNIQREDPVYSLSGDGLVSGQTLMGVKITCDALDVGTYAYDVDLSALQILDPQQQDKSANYEVTLLNSGHLSITPRDFKVTMTAEAKTYDGTAQTFLGHSATGLLEGDYLGFENAAVLTHVAEGKKENNPTKVQVFTSSGQEVTSNYNLVSLTSAKVSIAKRPITLTSEGAIKVYDGQPVGATNVTVSSGSLAPGDVLSVTNLASTSATNVADSGKNTFEYSLHNANGENVLGDYDVTVSYGIIAITPKPLSIKTADISQAYTGYQQSASFWVDGVSTTSWPAYLEAGEDLPEPYRLSMNVYPNSTLRYSGSRPFSGWWYLWTTDGSGAHYDNFSVSITYGTFAVTKRSLTLRSLGGSKHYDGTAFPNTVWIAAGSLADTDTISYGTVQPLVAVCSNATNPIGEVTITNSNAGGEAATESYDLKYMYGLVTIY